jgi:hypothetical protein
MLSAQQIETNKKKFLETSEKYGVMNAELLAFLGEDIFIAPAAATLDAYGCHPGGLVNHLLKACKYAIQVSDLLPANLQVAKESIIKATLLSQIGKTFLFRPNPSDWHRKNLGKMYEYNDDLVSMRVGERSAYYALNHGIKLNETEFQAIINSDKESDDKMAKFFSADLTNIIKHGVELAILEEKANGKNTN